MRFLFIPTTILGLAVLACSPFSVLPGSTGAAPTPTSTPSAGLALGGDSGQSDGDSQGESGEPPKVGPSGANAQCLVGTWSADHESFAGYLQDAFESNSGTSEIEFLFEAGGGDLLLTYDADGTMAMTGRDFQVDVEIVNLASFTFFVKADGIATYSANDDAIAIWDILYLSDAEGSGDVGGRETGETVAEISLTPELLFGYARSGLATLYIVDGAPADASTAPYSCQDDVLILGVEDYQPVRWHRVDG